VILAIRHTAEAARIDIPVVAPADSGQAGMTNMGTVFNEAKILPILEYHFKRYLQVR
nr:hypothetical protein [FCB group bacterium]